DVAVGFLQERLALHQTQPGGLAELIDSLSRDLGHRRFSLAIALPQTKKKDQRCRTAPSVYPEVIVLFALVRFSSGCRRLPARPCLPVSGVSIAATVTWAGRPAATPGRRSTRVGSPREALLRLIRGRGIGGICRSRCRRLLGRGFHGDPLDRRRLALG